ncbi:MAG: phosphotransferase [Oscillospiraceae bacterium]|jgi:Ser/Thr protein kinase RdoA (MazF antagonist)|nr:phosphotransferase [Oscillospiraceae bacterium]
MIDINSVWAIDGEVRKIHPSAWAVGDYVLKKGGKDALARNAQIMKRLSREGIRVAEPILSRSGEFVVGHEGGHYIMTKRLQGENVKDIYKLDYRKYARETGRALAQLHRAFRAIEREVSLSCAPFSDELKGWIHTELERAQWKPISCRDFAASTAPLLRRHEALPKQLIHRDFHYGNILFDEGVFSGCIDFDLSKWDIRIFDIGYFLTGLLADCEKDNEKVAAWLEICAAFVNGYERTEQLSAVEKESFPYLMECIELLFIAYFTKNEQLDAAAGATELYHFLKGLRTQLLDCLKRGCRDRF